jgi:hypothetical protein
MSNGHNDRSEPRFERPLEMTLRGPAEMARDLAAALEKARELGVAWRGTRFDRYDQVLRAAAATPADNRIPSPEGELYYEALNQAQQMIEAVGLALSVSAPLLPAKLRESMAGEALPAADRAGDHGRDTLFELAVAHLLSKRGLTVELTANEEDVIATHPALAEPLLVECKRPAMSAAQGEATNSVVRAMKTARQQLEKRKRRRGAGQGAVVLALDRLWSKDGNMTLAASTGRALRDMVRSGLENAVAEMIAAAQKKQIRVSPAIRAVGGVFVGVGLAGNERVLYSLMIMHLIVVSGSRRWKHQLARAFDGEQRDPR